MGRPRTQTWSPSSSLPHARPEYRGIGPRETRSDFGLVVDERKHSTDPGPSKQVIASDPHPFVLSLDIMGGLAGV